MGSSFSTSARSSSSASMPLRRMVLPRLANTSICEGLIASTICPRWETMQLKFSSWLRPSHSFSECSKKAVLPPSM